MSSVLSFLWRHKRKFIIGTAVIGGAVFMTRYCLRNLIYSQEAKAKEFINLSKKRQHFESTERTCNETVNSLISSFHDSVDRFLDSKSIVNQLKTSPANKVELWEELKVLVFARACLIVYGATVLNVILRVQINIIGGYLYRSATNRLDIALSGGLQEEYLSLCRYFLNHGMKELSALILKNVRDVVGPVRLDKNIDITEIQALFWSIQSAIEVEPNDPILFMERYIRNLSDSVKATQEAETFQEILNETVDIILSGDVCSLSSNLIWEGFQYTVDRIRGAFEESAERPHGIKRDLHRSYTSKRIPRVFKPMANALATVNSITRAPSSSDISDSFMYFLMNDESLKVFGANVYEAFCEK